MSTRLFDAVRLALPLILTLVFAFVSPQSSDARRLRVRQGNAVIVQPFACGAGSTASLVQPADKRQLAQSFDHKFSVIVSTTAGSDKSAGFTMSNVRGGFNDIFYIKSNVDSSLLNDVVVRVCFSDRGSTFTSELPLSAFRPAKQPSDFYTTYVVVQQEFNKGFGKDVLSVSIVLKSGAQARSAAFGWCMVGGDTKPTAFNFEPNDCSALEPCSVN